MKKLLFAALFCVCSKSLLSQTIPYTQVPLVSVNYFKGSVKAGVPLVEKQSYRGFYNEGSYADEQRLADSLRMEKKKNRQALRSQRKSRKS